MLLLAIYSLFLNDNWKICMTLKDVLCTEFSPLCDKSAPGQLRINLTCIFKVFQLIALVAS